MVIAGFGDTGLLVAINLGDNFDIVGISPKPALVSGQELGMRLTQPQLWKRDYLMPFSRYKKLDGVRTLQGLITSIDTQNATVTALLQDGTSQVEPYDALLISSGVTNGFWRNSALEDFDTISRSIDTASQELLQARTIAVIGGGATGVSVAVNLAAQHREKSVHFFFSDVQPLPGYHPKVRSRVEQHLKTVGVTLHPGHRAVIPDGFQCDRFTTEPVAWRGTQEPFTGDLTLWAVGNMVPNNSFIPPDMLNTDGFVKTDACLRVEGYQNVFAVGDIAASDPHRSSARNWGYRLLGHNIRAHLEGRDNDMKRYEPPRYRWGSVFGVQQNGLRVFQPDGSSFRFPKWTVRSLLFPLAVRRMIYKGIRKG
ncbi:Demethylphylloquinone reductase NdbB [Halioglobus japonicus]|nr:Demethylphylloquinone reductase NdbB [Halioglobus japonicus]